MKKSFILVGVILFFYTNTNAQFSVSGYVYQPDTANPTVTQGAVFLFKYDTSKPVFPKMDSVNLGPNGDFTFSGVQPGNYLIKIYPNLTAYPSLMPSYYGDTVFWTGASVLTIDTGNLSNININVKKKPAWNASTNYCNGHITFGSGKTSANLLGDPVPGLDVSLTQIPGGVMRSTTTDQTGFFQFGNIPDSSTYKVIVDLPGVDIPNPLQITMGDGGDTILNVDYTVDTTSGMIFSATKVLQKENFEIKIFPNPNNGKFTVISYQSSVISQIIIYNMLGEIIYSKQRTTNNEQLTTNLKSGIYFVEISSGEKIYTEKIIVE